MLAFIRSFARKEHGAVTVDWVLISGLAIGLGVVVSNYFVDPLDSLTDKTGDAVSEITPQTGL